MQVYDSCTLLDVSGSGSDSVSCTELIFGGKCSTVLRSAIKCSTVVVSVDKSSKISAFFTTFSGAALQ